MPQRCPNEHEIAEGVNFCPVCGARVVEAVSEDSLTSAEGSSREPEDVVAGESWYRSMRLIVALLAALVIMVAIAVGSFVVLPAVRGVSRHTLTGTLSAPQCGGGYSITNANIEVKDQAGKLIGAGTTGSNNGLASAGGCEVSFVIDNLPKANFYQVTIGTHGGPSYTYDELAALHWQLDLSLK
jgi:hypothetical protein